MTTPFVFLPGTLCDERLWKHQTSRFSPHYVVNLRNQESIQEMLESVAQSPFESFILVGFSMGGYIAQEFALKYPQRVEKLAIIGCSSEGYPADEKAIAMKAFPLLKQGLFKGITDRRLRDFLHPQAYENAELRALIQSMAGPDANAVYFRQLSATLERRDLSKEVRNIQCPVLFIAGIDDRIVSFASIDRSMERFPRANILALDDCGHFVPLEKPEEVNEALLKFTQCI
jgi:pimeloyl-ACP methyl ester carboxylesterase